MDLTRARSKDMDSAKIYELLLWASLSINGFLGTYFLSGIKSQIKSMREEMTEVREEQIKHNERQNMSEYRITALEADYKDLPCMHKSFDCTKV
jgi:predicted ester cyclase